MDVINKLYSSVSSTVSQLSLSSVYPGNPIFREYEVGAQLASAGPGLLWKVFAGWKKSTRQEAAIFLVEKRMLDRWSANDKQLLIDVLRRGVSQLTKLRHPQVLTVQHPLEESRDALAFATEPVFGSLANILGVEENLPVDRPNKYENYKLHEVEIKYGLMQIGEVLIFLHGDAKLLHRNICPENIIINKQGVWKIFGFDFCVGNTNIKDAKPYWPFEEYDPGKHPLLQQTLDYLAPECVLTKTHSPASDIYSLGMLIYSLYNKGEPLLKNKSYEMYSSNMKQLHHKTLSHELASVVPALQSTLKMMLNVTPELRPDAHQFTKIDFFEDVGVKALVYLDNLYQIDNLQKSQFYKGLPQIIQNLPHRICIDRVLPCLFKEFVNPSMVPFVLPNILQITENATENEYYEHIFPHLKTAMKIQEPIQVLLIFMQNMKLLLKVSRNAEIQSHVLPMVYNALEAEVQQVQELCLSVLPTFADNISFPEMRNAVLPRIKRVCLQTPFVSVRVNCLVCLGKLLLNLDKWTVTDDVLPFLPLIPSKDPAVLMGILGIYKIALTNAQFGISKEVLATKILPFLMPLSIDNDLTLNQFNSLITLVKEMVNRVEREHRNKLEQLNSMQKEQRVTGLNILGKMPQLVEAPSNQPPDNGLDTFFAELGIQNTSSHNIPSEVANINGGTNTLSMEEKQRLAKQQEAQQRLQSQPTLNPKHVTQTKTTTVKDLTSTLIESNLSQMNQMAVPRQQMTVQWPQSPVPVRPNFGPFQSATTGPSWPVMPNIPPAPMNPSMSMLYFSPQQKPPQQPTKSLSSTEIDDLLS